MDTFRTDVTSRTFEIEALVRRGYESIDVDYKGPGNWSSWDKRAKAELSRDMMAFGNADRPGWIVLGISEGAGGQWLYQGLDEAASRSFDPTNIGSFVKRYSDPEVSFEVYRRPVDDILYVLIRVLPFTTVPHVCKESCGEVLSEGALYIRTEACQTSKVTTAQQIRQLIDRATQAHADSIVRRVEALYERAHGLVEAIPSGLQRPKWLDVQLGEVRRRSGAL